jgi:RNA polymerase sigma-70 factor (sigma-E family)
MTRSRTHPDLARQEFDAFVAASAAPLLRAAYLVVWDEFEAEDLVQECLSKVAKRWPRVRTMESPRAYARKILMNLAIDSGQRLSRRSSELGVPESVLDEVRTDSAAARELDSVHTRAELRTALAALTARQRAVLALRYFEDLSEAETARALGCSVGTVKSTTSRALGSLQQTLERINAETTSQFQTHGQRRAP